VTIRKVHIRYEDGQTNSSGYPFATGVTLQSLSMKTTANTDEGQIKLKVDKFSIQLFGGGGGGSILLPPYLIFLFRRYLDTNFWEQ
jgi:Vacuolar sorting-associated protein 13, N-terminal